MESKNLHEVLQQLASGEISVEVAEEGLKDLPFLDLGHTKIDFHRALRNGIPEVIYSSGKTTEQVVEIMTEMKTRVNVLATRVSDEMGYNLLLSFPEGRYCSLAKTFSMEPFPMKRYKSTVGIITAGTSDLPIARESQSSLRMMGIASDVISDVGVAGVHRLFARLEQMRSYSVLIVIAGMEGALPSVIGGLVDQPIISVPTSVGYGANFQGMSALLGMLTSCSSGITVVNIDNGFGAACAAGKIVRAIENNSIGK